MILPIRTVALALCVCAAATAQFTADFGRHLPPESFRGGIEQVLADLDGDGDLDLVRGPRWFTNDGHARFSLAGVFPVPDERYLPQAADFDRDGDVDVVLFAQRQTSAAPLHFLRNDGSAFSLVRSEPDAQAAGLRTADLDGDGDPDLVSGSHWRRNDGAFAFTTIDLVARTTRILPADLDGDGDVDLVGPRVPSGLLVLENDGAGNFVDVSAARSAALLPGFRTTPLDAADVDGDGDVDLLGTGPALLIRSGTSFVDATASALPSGYWFQTAAFGDLDGDGDSDIVSAGQWLRNTRGAFSVGTPAIDPRADIAGGDWDIDVADLDGDGRLDVVGDAGLLYLNSGGGVLRGDRRPFFAAFLRTWPKLAADFDADGDLDLLAGRGALRYFENQDGVGFADVTGARLFGLGSEPVHRLRVGDVDGDGQPDLFAGTASRDRLLLNVGSGRLLDTTLSRLPIDFGENLQIELSDIDGDGDLDALTSSAAGLRVFDNDGSGIFAAGRVIASRGFLRIGFGVGDLDGDGDPDIVGTLGLALANDGSGGFVDVSAAWVPPGGWGAGWIRCLDVDQDGDLDMVGPTDGATRVYRNDGSGRLRPVSDAGLPIRTSVEEFEPLDVDLDGDIDLIDDGELFLNDGQGRFRRLASTGEAIAADLDGDGDPDLVGEFGASMNRLRHVSLPFRARPGRPWAIRVHAAERGAPAPQALAVPVVAFASVPAVAVPGLGLWRLDPSSAVALAVRPIDPRGALDYGLLIPTTSTLVGATLHVQAVIADPLVGIGLTALVRDVIR